MLLPMPYLTTEQLRAEAERFLTQYHPSGDIPVPIEEIVELGMEIEIRPIRGLEARFGFEGALTHDLATILIDEERMTQFPNRYRFALAHEIAHREMHGDLIRGLGVTNREVWKATVSSIDAKTYGRLESQAYVLAGHILVPTVALRASCDEARELAINHGVDLGEMGASAISYVAGHMAKSYRVSTAVLERRLRDEDAFLGES